MPPPDKLSRFIWDPVSRFLASRINIYVSSLVPPPPREPDAPPRKVLVVHCHPAGPNSFSGACAATVKSALEGAGHQVKAVSLYDPMFQPALTPDDFKQYMRTPIEEREGVEDVKAHVNLLRWCDSFVVVYPTWWYGLPAALKGWLDRCFLPQVAFTLPSPDNPVKPTIVGLCPQLTNITKVGVVTTYGCTLPQIRWVGDCGRRTIARGVRPLLHPECTILWLGLYGSDTATKEDREVFLERIKNEYAEF